MQNVEFRSNVVDKCFKRWKHNLNVTTLNELRDLQGNLFERLIELVWSNLVVDVTGV